MNPTVDALNNRPVFGNHVAQIGWVAKTCYLGSTILNGSYGAMVLLLYRKIQRTREMETRLASPELGGNSEDLQRHYQKKVGGQDQNEPNKGKRLCR